MTNIIPFLLLLLLVPLVFLAVVLWGRQRWEHEPAAILLKSFLWGAAAVFPLLFWRWLTAVIPSLTWQSLAQRSQLGLVPTQIVLLLVAALVIELLKNQALLTAWAGSHPFLIKLSDGAFYSAATAIGFSLIDNASFLVTDIARFAWPDFVHFAIQVVSSTALYLLTTISFGLYYVATLAAAKGRPLTPFSWSQCQSSLATVWRFHQLRAHVVARCLARHHCRCERQPVAILAEGWLLVVLLQAFYGLVIGFV